MEESPSFEKLIKELSNLTQKIENIKTSQVKGKADNEQLQRLQMVEEYIDWFNKVNIRTLHYLEEAEKKPTEASLKEEDQIQHLKNKLVEVEKVYDKEVKKLSRKEKKQEQKKKKKKRRKKFRKLGGDGTWIPS